MVNGVHPCSLSWSHTSGFAPRLARYRTASATFLYAAACIAVSPFLPTALGSLPSSMARAIASTTSLSVPPSSPADRVPSPAATISGVAPSAAGIFGSAPSGTKKRISSESAVSAARQKGVAPMLLRLVRPKLIFFVMRVLMFAPFAANFLIGSRLVMLPEPPGAGSLSPPPGLRMEGMA